jgi:hypothetical protein
VQQAPHAYHPEYRILHPAADNHDDLWRSLYIDELGPASALRLFTPPCLLQLCPAERRSREDQVSSRGSGGCTIEYFQRVYKDNKAETAFPQGGTDPDEFLKVYRDNGIPQDQVSAWQKDRATTIVENALPRQQGWRRAGL